MNEVLKLRRGERFNPAEVDDEQLEVMHERLDRLGVEIVAGPLTGLGVPARVRKSWRAVVESILMRTATVLAWLAVVTLIGLWVAAGLGWFE